MATPDARQNILAAAAGGAAEQPERVVTPDVVPALLLATEVQQGDEPSSAPAAAEDVLQSPPLEQPDQAAAMITPAKQARAAARSAKQRIESLQQRSEAAAPAERAGSAVLASPRKPRWERPDQATAAATLGGGATMARCASDAAQQAQRNHALVSELKQHLTTSGPRPAARSAALVRPLTSAMMP